MRISVLGSGSGGNAAVVASGRTAVLVDAGFRASWLARRCREAGVSPEALSGVFLTHEHGDHVLGAIEFSEKFGVPLFCSGGTAQALGLDGSLFGSYVHLEPGGETVLGEMLVRTYGTPHDANEPLAYRFEDSHAACVVASDLGRCERELDEFLAGVQALVFEFNHDEEMLRDGPYHWALKKRISGGLGHLSNRESAGAVSAAAWHGLREVVAIHLSRQNNDPALVRALLSETLERSDCSARFGCADQSRGYEPFEV
jgi:phosphoribosyl 1,2-cyclic phosphodiesterase